jgi:hypothetical protein
MTGTAAWILTAMVASSNGNATAGIGIGTAESSNGNETVAPPVILTMIARIGGMIVTAIRDIGTVSSKLRPAEDSRYYRRRVRHLLPPAFSFRDRNSFAVRQYSPRARPLKKAKISSPIKIADNVDSGHTRFRQTLEMLNNELTTQDLVLRGNTILRHEQRNT